MAIHELLDEMIQFFEAWPVQTDHEEEMRRGLLMEMKGLGPATLSAPNKHPVVEAWFEQSISPPRAIRSASLLDALDKNAALLHWNTNRTDYVSTEFSANYSFAQIIGHGTRAASVGFYDSRKIAVGFSLQGPGQFYPPHNHSATEFYGMLAGSARWQRENNEPGILPPGSTIFHARDVTHAMETLDEPMLNIWAWTGDMNGKTIFPSKTWLT